ncbi:MAG: hypothetical protein IJP31_03400 [Lachnospiraceae bacterium]|nr:hypothetical protein [Lachnospiraceae bacterium]
MLQEYKSKYEMGCKKELTREECSYISLAKEIIKIKYGKEDMVANDIEEKYITQLSQQIFPNKA